MNNSWGANVVNHVSEDGICQKITGKRIRTNDVQCLQYAFMLFTGLVAVLFGRWLQGMSMNRQTLASRRWRQGWHQLHRWGVFGVCRRGFELGVKTPGRQKSMTTGREKAFIRGRTQCPWFFLPAFERVRIREYLFHRCFGFVRVRRLGHLSHAKFYLRDLAYLDILAKWCINSRINVGSERVD